MSGVVTAFPLEGNHASRPAASSGAILYACTTHGLVYRSDGSSWSTFLTLPSAGYSPGGTDVAVADGGTGASSASAARTNLGLVIGTDVEAHDADLTAIAGLSPSNDDIIQRKAGAWTNRTIAQLISDLNAGGLSGGGSGVSLPSFVQKATATNSTTVTMGSTPTNGNRIILCVTGSSAATTAVSSSNTVWTKMGEFTTGGSSRMSVWVGVCSASAGTAITITNGSTFVQAVAVEVPDALTPTNATFTGQTVAANNNTNYLPLDAFTPSGTGHLVAIYQATDNAGNQPVGYPTVPNTPVAVVTGQRLALAYSLNKMHSNNGWQSNGGIVWSEIT